MERATKLFLFAWAVVALAFEIHLASRGWPSLPWLAALSFVSMFLLARITRRAMAIALGWIFVLPAAIVTLHGEYVIFFQALWMAALLGGMAPDAISTRWHIPVAWRSPIVCWGLVVALTAPIVVAREIDFDPALLADSQWILWSSVLGVGPSYVAQWITYVAATTVLGILWFDWLFGVPADDFRAAVAAPLLASAMAMCGVATYQLFGHSLFLNATLFGGMGRASGTMLDANLCGTAAALMAGAAFAWVIRYDARHIVAVGVFETLCAAAVWASGSRTAFLLLLIVAGFSAVGVYMRSGQQRRPVFWRVAAGGAIVASIVAIALTRTHPELVGPLRRLADMVPSLSVESIRNVASELWNRNRYGTAAVSMIRDFPASGVGVGSFHVVVPDFGAVSSPGGSLTPDNAQNWFRHQLAELGVVGSIGWILWVALFASFLFKRRPGRSVGALWALRGTILGLAIISLVGMPTQDLTLIIAFWTLVYWFTREAGVPAAPTSVSRMTWAAIVLVVIASGVVTAFAAEKLRPPVRAQRFGWQYVYGFYDPEPDGAGGEFRWSARRGVAVLDKRSAWLELAVSANHSDLSARPVDARVWLGRQLVLRTRLRTPGPVVEYIRLRSNESRILLETAVNRVVRPRDYGLPDDRELGLMVDWKFVSEPPPGATIVEEK